MSDPGISQHVLLAASDLGADWIYLLFVLAISLLSWLANVIKKHREEKNATPNAAEDVTEVEPGQFIEDERPELTPSPLPAQQLRPAQAIPPLAQPVPEKPTIPLPPTQSGPAVVLAALSQRQPLPTPSPTPIAAQPQAKSTPQKPAKPKTGRQHIDNAMIGNQLRNHGKLRQAIVLAEVLGKPIALRPESPE